MDTGLVLQVRAGLDVISSRLASLVRVCTELTDRERSTPMAGRTHGQHALPITLGFKTAIWLSELQRHQERLNQARPRVLVGQLSGAAGTLASLGEEGLAVQAAFCRELDLAVPDIAWHVARDGLAELASILAMVAGTCSRIAGEIILLQKTEVAELEERQLDANVGSSTMPQKRNPMTAEGAVAAGRLARRNVTAALEGMLGQHERDMATWQSEWAWVPDLFLTTDATLALTHEVVADVRVDREQMAANLKLSGGRIMAEAVMLQLARHVGRQTAHDVVHRIAMRSAEENVGFLEALAADDSVRDVLGDRDAIAAILDPAHYLGAVDQMIGRVLDRGTTNGST
jgi:3-carboxy-cis,cis-muconate cycloisomerase